MTDPEPKPEPEPITYRELWRSVRGDPPKRRRLIFLAVFALAYVAMIVYLVTL